MIPQKPCVTAFRALILTALGCTIAAASASVLAATWALAAPSASAMASTSVHSPTNGWPVADEPTRPIDAIAELDPHAVTEGLTPLGQTGGFAGVAATDGRLVVLGVGPRLYVLDLLFPEEPLIVGQTDLLGGVVTGATLSGGHAYLAAGLGGLVVVDLTDPTSPRLVGHLDTFDHVNGVAVDGDHAFLLNAFSELLVVDVSDPTEPRASGQLMMDGGIPAAIAAANGHVFLTAREDPWSDGQLHVVRVADPTQPVEIAVLPTDGPASDVAVYGSHVLVANGEAGLLVVDVTDPAAPRGVGQVDPDWYAASVRVYADTAYVTDFAFGVQIVDVSTPASPTELGWLALPNGAEDVAVYEGYAYVADGNSLQVGDVSDPTQPLIAGTVPAAGPMLAEAVAVANDRAYVADDFRGLSVVSLGDPRRPREVGMLTVDLPAADVTVDGTNVYLASGRTTIDAPPDGRVTVINALDPEAPVLVVEFAPGGSASGVAATANWLYVGDGANGLRIFDTTDPQSPREVGSLVRERHSVGKLYVDADRQIVLAAAGDAGLLVIDVADPTAPRLLATVPTGGEARAVAGSASYAYVAAGSAGLRVIELSDPAAPREIGFVDTTSFAQGVAVDGDQVIVADGGGLVAIDITDPAAPRIVETIALADSARSVAIQNGMAVVAAEAAGLYAIGGAGPTQSAWLPLVVRRFSAD